MVVKGRARGGPAALAAHLLRRDSNEQVIVRELRGVSARDLRTALQEMDCMGAGAASRRTLYHAAINTAPDETLTEEQKLRAVECLEKELGFTGQPRIIVEHLKKGREHIHVVFLRIDTHRMIAIPDSHNYRKHEAVARALEREFGHRLVRGAHIDRDDHERPTRTPSHAEMQQAERSGISPKASAELITRLWNQADNSKGFIAALAAEGWQLVRGDRRDFVLIDPTGETHSLARRVKGNTLAEIRARLSDIKSSDLLSVADARALQIDRQGRMAEPVSRALPNAVPELSRQSVRVLSTWIASLPRRAPSGGQEPYVGNTNAVKSNSDEKAHPISESTDLAESIDHALDVSALKKRMTPTELNEMIGRQQQRQNQRGGPSH